MEKTPPIPPPLPPLRSPQSNPTASAIPPRPHPPIPTPTPTPPTVNPSPTTTSKETHACHVAAMGINPQQQPLNPFTPCYIFFYGSLMDAEVLQSVLGLPGLPSSSICMLKGEITGFAMKMWGIYPAIIRNGGGGGGKISGMVWKVDSESHFLRLQEYETGAYTWCLCDVELEDGQVLQGCRTFCWAGDPGSKELDEGSFDLLRYQKYFKSSVVRK